MYLQGLISPGRTCPGEFMAIIYESRKKGIQIRDSMELELAKLAKKVVLGRVHGVHLGFLDVNAYCCSD